MNPKSGPLALIIIDGWGYSDSREGNAIALAATPFYDELTQQYPHTLLEAHGSRVGLPPGIMGNSEVGHLNIGAGRVIRMDVSLVDHEIETGAFFKNKVLLEAIEGAKNRGRSLHLMGLCSDGQVHSSLTHLYALLQTARTHGLDRVFVHCFLDGRDTPPSSGADYVATLQRKIDEIGVGRIATVIGRYYAMDRDSRWERTDRAFRAISLGEGEVAEDPIAAVRASYDIGVTDEFIEPLVLQGRPRLRPEDVAIFFNFRPDRTRQLSQRLVEAGIDLTTMTRYSDELDVPVAFAEQEVAGTLAETLAAAGARQLHMAETEKYAHVTYFFNGGVEAAWPGETRILVPSPRDVPSYDFKPEMSAHEVTARFAAAIGDGYRFAVVNFANPDMVGHTGSIPAVTRAVEATDECLAVVIESTHAAGGVCLVTADHGNAETMLEADGVSPHTAHTTNPVPLVVTSAELPLRDSGELADLAPTALALLGLAPPPLMTGVDLCAAAKSGPPN